MPPLAAGFTREQIARWHADFLRKCPTGLVTARQFQAHYALLLPAHLAAPACRALPRKLFALFDLDADGRLNFAEFLLSFWVRCRAPLREKVKISCVKVREKRKVYVSFFCSFK